MHIHCQWTTADVRLWLFQQLTCEGNSCFCECSRRDPNDWIANLPHRELGLQAARDITQNHNNLDSVTHPIIIIITLSLSVYSSSSK